MTKEIKALIEKNDSISLFMHKRPDGDSISSSYGLALAILQAFPNKKVNVVADLKYLKENFKFINWREDLFTEVNTSSLAIMGDGAGKERIWYFDEYIKSENKILYDHHQNDSDFETNIFWHEPDYPASALQAYEIVKEFNIEINEETAIALIVGIITDTGFFKFSGVNQNAPKSFSELLSFISFEGINDLYNRMSARSKDDIEIQKFIYDKLQYDGRIAYCIFDKEDVEKYSEHKIKMKVNSIGHIGNTDIWIFVIWSDESKHWKVSMRTKGPKISEIATKWNGGGHHKAAAARLESLESLPELFKDLKAI